MATKSKAKETRELGEPTFEDRIKIHEIAEVMTMEAFSVAQLESMILDAWVLGHNQGYEDAYTEMEGK